MTTITLKIESDLKTKAQAIAKEFGLSLSSLIKMLLNHTIKSGKLDIEAKPRHNNFPEPGDLVFKNLKEAVAYSKKLANEEGHMEENV